MNGDALTVEVQDGIAIITIDLPDEPVNKFSAAVIAEFDEVLTQFETMRDVKAAVLISGKPDVFIAGADIDAFLEFKSAADAEAASASGHRMMSRLESSRVPVVAAIHGACLGAGLEMSLACAYRIATDHP
jgi:3-hydroxyacyl-CoA dehydrogenase / enoyl-CoA hydratase / 3-hydroxybutyryl-CoA epimerase